MDESELARRALDPVEVDEVALERVRSRLRAEIARERRRRRGRWLPLVAAALGAAAVVFAAAFVVPTPQEAAAAELRRLGAIAARQEPVRPGPGEYLLVRSEQLRRESFTTIGVEGSFDLLTRLRVSMWVATDGSAFRREEVVSSTFASAADRQAWIDAGSPEFTLPRTHEYGPGEAPLHDVGGLPEDPAALLEALRSGAVVERPPGDDQVFLVIGEILAQGVAPPGLRSGLFEAAARLDGVVLVGEAEDPLGRPGTAVELDADGFRTRLVFDPDSAQLLAVEVYGTNAEGKEELASWRAAEPAVVVDEAPRLDG
jgi:hypothetical protein